MPIPRLQQLQTSFTKAQTKKTIKSTVNSPDMTKVIYCLKVIKKSFPSYFFLPGVHSISMGVIGRDAGTHTACEDYEKEYGDDGSRSHSLLNLELFYK